MRQSHKRLLVVLLIILGVILFDQLAKYFVRQRLAPGDTLRPIPALADYFQIVRSTNSGAAFGIFQNVGDLFLVLAFVVVAGMLYYYPRLPENATITRLATGLLCGGALGNALDRLQQGQVTDFIHYQIPGLISNVSNLADHAIVLGVLLMIWDNWRLERATKRQKPTESTESTPKTDSN